MNYSSRYINDRFLPDKAIDVVDEACSKVSLRGFKVPENVYKLEKTQTELAKELEDAIKSGNRCYCFILTNHTLMQCLFQFI